MPNILLHIFFVAMAAGAILVAYEVFYVLYLIISDSIHGRAINAPMFTAGSESVPTPGLVPVMKPEVEASPSTSTPI